MNAANTEWFLAILTFFVGMGLGALLYRILSTSGRSGHDLHKKLQDAEFELTRYREQVNDHFARTAELVKNLNKNYQEIQQHLAESANDLCDDKSVTRKLTHDQPLEKKEARTPAASAAEAFLDVEAPKDYAPKSKDEAGTLSEEYGLKSKETEPGEREEEKEESSVAKAS